MNDGPWGTYVHVPWCHHRCPYCAFYVETGEAPWDAFVDRVLREDAVRRPVFGDHPHTVFLGGGTPSRMPAEPLARLLRGLDPLPGAEISAEVNPEDIAGWLDGALSAGITRLSLGVQTFHAAHAKRLGRAATVKQARDACQRVAASGIETWSVDLIFAVPGQTLADLDADLDAILDLGAPHVSLYGLTYEEGTPFERARARGKMVPVDDDTWRAMYERIVARLRSAGLQRYEVSNFARPGHESAHNRLYWTDRPYLGLGPSAHGYAPDGTRWIDVADVGAWLAREDPTASSEIPAPRDRAVDLLVSALRSREGIDLERLRRRTGHSLSASTLAPLLADDLLVTTGSGVALGEAGFPVADAVVRHLADRLAVEPEAD